MIPQLLRDPEILCLPFGIMLYIDKVFNYPTVSVKCWSYRIAGKVYYLDKPIVGEATCSSDDFYMPSRGYKIAVNRLVAKVCMKILKAVPIPDDEEIFCVSSD